MLGLPGIAPVVCGPSRAKMVGVPGCAKVVGCSRMAEMLGGPTMAKTVGGFRRAKVAGAKVVGSPGSVKCQVFPNGPLWCWSWVGQDVKCSLEG